MRQTKRFAVVGSDARQAAAGRALARAGYTVGGVQQLPQADCILLPLPLEQSGLPLAQLLGMAKPGALALGGKVTDSARTIARAAGVELVDYFARPELTVYNAIPTAEGCIGILLERRSRTLWGAAVLVLGFGPVGRALAVRLAAGLSDTPVTLAAKSLLRVGSPVVLAVSTNDGLGASGENMARLCQRKHYYFVPYGQDDPFAKPQSLKADLALLPAAVDAALRGEQLQPVLLGQRNV